MHRFIRGTFTRADSQSLERVTHTRSICSTRSNAYEAYQAVFCVIGDGHECVLIPVDIHRRRHLQSMNFQKPLRLKVIAHFSRHYSRSNGDWLAFCAPNLSYPDASRTHLCYVCCGTVRGGRSRWIFYSELSLVWCEHDSKQRMPIIPGSKWLLPNETIFRCLFAAQLSQST